MSLTECYIALGGSYEEVLSRLSSERLVNKFVLKFLTDQIGRASCRERV